MPYYKKQLEEFNEDGDREDLEDGRLLPAIPFTSPVLDPAAKLFLKREILLPVTDVIQDVEASDAGSYCNFFVADRDWLVISITEVHRVASSGGTIQVERIPSGTAKASGNNLLATAFDLTAGANTPRFGTLTATQADLVIRRGDRLGSKIASVTGTPEDIAITVLLRLL